MARASKTFAGWLQDRGASDFPALAVAARAPDWEKVGRLEQAWALIEAAQAVDAAEKPALKQQAALAFLRFRDDLAPRNRLFGVNAFGLGVFLFMAAIVAILAGAIFEASPFWGRTREVEPLLTRLSDVETARGLITFVFTIGVIALSLIIVTANVTTDDGAGTRFERSKEILTTLIAILGTILGFYFGKADAPPAAARPVAQAAAPSAAEGAAVAPAAPVRQP